MNSMDTNTIAIIGGILIGLIAVIGLRKSNPTKFDERQKMVRGRGYKYGFISMMLADIAVYLLSNLMPIPRFFFVLIPIFISDLIFMTYTILNHAYYGYNKKNNTPILLTVLGIIWLIAVFINPSLEDKITNGFLSLICLIPAVSIWIDRYKTERDDE